MCNSNNLGAHGTSVQHGWWNLHFLPLTNRAEILSLFSFLNIGRAVLEFWLNLHFFQVIFTALFLKDFLDCSRTSLEVITLTWTCELMEWNGWNWLKSLNVYMLLLVCDFQLWNKYFIFFRFINYNEKNSNTK